MVFVPRAVIRSTNKPFWHNKELSRLKNVRNKEYKKLCIQRQNCPDADESSFLDAKVNFEQYRRQLHNDFIRDKASSLKSDPKSFWKFVNSKRTSNLLPSIMNYEGQTATNDSEKSNLFAQFFQNVYINRGVSSSLNDFIDQRSEQNCFKIHISYENVYSVLSSMDLNKGSGHDGVSSIFLRQCADVLCEPLRMIFTQSISDGCYPVQFKIGQITPIFKSGKKSDVTNYRGVNVLPNLAKVFERAVYCQLKMIIAPRISKTQHGFLANRNIESNLMELTTLVHEAFEQGAQLNVFYADIAKAFDSVDTSLMIRKLANFPVSNDILRWFLSYLHDRKQYIRVKAAKSNTFSVPSGVGQGTILGPLLFLIFFNDSDSSNDVLPNIFYLNFADDKKIAAIIKTEDDALRIQKAIDKFMEWCDENGLTANVPKCKIMVFNEARNLNTYTP